MLIGTGASDDPNLSCILVRGATSLDGHFVPMDKIVELLAPALAAGQGWRCG